MPKLTHSGLYIPTASRPAVWDLKTLWLAHATPWKAQVHLGGRRAATAECTGAEGAFPYLTDITPGRETELEEHIAGCRRRGEEVDEGEWIDALVEEYETGSLLLALRLGERLVRVRTPTGGTEYRQVRVPPGADVSAVVAELFLPPGHRELWTGHVWEPLNDK
ncbi:hypothetical protein ACWFMI_23700 [Nocardiopsis terrae]|uniref:hypothetical protein n=1 Tax=Streptomyces sp. NPDC057554 TaxID=3350538 RepID=UPI0036BA1B90